MRLWMRSLGLRSGACAFRCNENHSYLVRRPDLPHQRWRKAARFRDAPLLRSGEAKAEPRRSKDPTHGFPSCGQPLGATGRANAWRFLSWRYLPLGIACHPHPQRRLIRGGVAVYGAKRLLAGGGRFWPAGEKGPYCPVCAVGRRKTASRGRKWRLRLGKQPFSQPRNPRGRQDWLSTRHARAATAGTWAFPTAASLSSPSGSP